MDFFTEYFIFDGHLTILQGLLNLVSFSELSHWKMIFYGFLIGFIFKKFHSKEWGESINNIGFITIPLAAFLVLAVMAPNSTKTDKEHYSDITKTALKMDTDYRQWREKNWNKEVNPEWKKERDSLSNEINETHSEIIIKLSNQLFFILFIFIGFFYKKHTLKNYFSRVKNEYQEVSREVKLKKEQEKQHKELEEKQAYDELKNEELRLRRMEEKRLEITLEKERTKQKEAESSVELKKLDVERPEKEKNISNLLKKLDDL